MPSALTISWWFFCTVFFSPSQPPTPTLLPPVDGLLTQPAVNVQAAANRREISWRFIVGNLRGQTDAYLTTTLRRYNKFRRAHAGRGTPLSGPTSRAQQKGRPSCGGA